jgi:hypothetical protein
VDGLDQAVQETGFIWSKPYKARLVATKETKDALFFEAEHNGYARLKDPVWHRRRILFSEGTTLLIKDGFWGKGVHRFELTYHLHPKASVNKEGNWWIIEREEARIFMRLQDGQDFVVVKGQKDPLLGWYSPAYGIKEEAAVLHATMTGEASNVSFRTVICAE